MVAIRGNRNFHIGLLEMHQITSQTDILQQLPDNQSLQQSLPTATALNLNTFEPRSAAPSHPATSETGSQLLEHLLKLLSELFDSTMVVCKVKPSEDDIINMSS